ncbi:acyl-CoA thioesterase [Roseibium sp.]|uniref:acyl-CoA thioesterase n=1 Tax=Roseibium sp. TaxID=1936156 RepID=UPI003A97E53A
MTTDTTLYSFVNEWECDENDHLNVQFYFGRFEEADRQFQLLSGLSEAIVGARRVRHVRYHNELRAGDLLTVSSYAALDGPHMFTVVHEMRNATTGTLAATAIDGYTPPAAAAKEIRPRFKNVLSDMSEDAAPRGLPASPANAKLTIGNVLASGAEICFRGTVLPRHLGPDGRADDGFVLGAFTDAVPHVWQRTPMNHAFLTENGYGRVAVEMKLTWSSPLKTGDMFVIASAPVSVAGKTFTLRHHMFESRTQRLVAILDVVALVMDLTTRKAVALPEVAIGEIAKISMG